MKTVSRLLTIILCLWFSGLIPLSQLIRPVNAQTQTSINFKFPEMGVKELSDPDYYELIDKQINTTDTQIPSKIVPFEKTYYAFSLNLTNNSDFLDISFRVKLGDGNLTPVYKIDLADTFFGDKDIEKSTLTTSELYAFTKGIQEVHFFYEGEKHFDLIKYGNDSDSRMEQNIKPQEVASTAAEREYKEKLFNSLGFDLVTREEWGAPTASNWGPTIADVNRIVVHHTATSVDMSNPKNTVKSIYNYHKNRCSSNVGSAPGNCDYSETWQDIGYNYLIDPYGRVYEGRAGGNGVVGAHAIPNPGSIGISLLGNFTSQAPTQAAMESLTRLVSHLSELNHFNVKFKDGLYGHRDVSATACPGAYVYNQLPTVVNAANAMKGINSTVAFAAQKSEELLENREYAKKEGEVEIIVDASQVSNNLKEKLLTKSRGAEEVSQINDKIIYKVPESKVDQLVSETIAVSRDIQVQPNFIYKLESWDNSSSSRSIPSDYNVSTHWNSERTKAPEAWKLLGGCTIDNSCGGDDTIKVAVLDTGVAYENYNYDAGSSFTTYEFSGLYIESADNTTQDGQFNEGYDRVYTRSPELSNTTFVNPRDTAQEYLCGLRELDPNSSRHCNTNELAKIDHANDDQGHGTFVTTIIAANTGDETPNKVIGVASNVQVMPVKVFLPNDKSMCQDSNGELDLTCADSDYDFRSTGNSYTIASGIDYAVANGADVINLSLRGYGTDPIIKTAVDNAFSAGVVVVAAAGNDADDIANYFPASYTNVIAVGASTTTNTKASYSNYGEELDIVAPVGDYTTAQTASLTLSCYPNKNLCSDETNPNMLQTYSSSSTPTTSIGTSFAAPQATAAVALVLSVKPELTPTQVYNLLTGTATEVGGVEFSTQTGYGILNIGDAIANASDVPEPPDVVPNASPNGDNMTDIIAFNPSTKTVDVTPSTGTNFGGGYKGYQVWNSNTGYSASSWKLLKPSDVDADGDLDLIAFNTQTTQIDVTLSNGSNFGGGYKGYQVWNYNTGFPTNTWTLLDPADVNGDERADIIAFNRTTTQVNVALSDGVSFGGYGSQVWNSRTSYSTRDWTLLNPSDVDGNGMADLVAFNRSSTGIDVTLSNGSNFGGGYKGYQVWNSRSSYSSSSWRLLDLADANGDGMADIIAFNPSTSGVDVTPSTGANFGGGYKGYQVWNSRTAYSTRDWKVLDPSDVNGDGKADIIAFNINNTTIDVTPSTGSNFGGGYKGYQVWNSRSSYSASSWRLLN